MSEWTAKDWWHELSPWVAMLGLLLSPGILAMFGLWVVGAIG